MIWLFRIVLFIVAATWAVEFLVNRQSSTFNVFIFLLVVPALFYYLILKPLKKSLNL